MVDKIARLKYLDNSFEIIENGTYVICAVSGLADVLGIGSHNIPSGLPYFGLWQSLGLISGLVLIAIGVLLYAQRYSPNIEEDQYQVVDPANSE